MATPAASPLTLIFFYPTQLQHFPHALQWHNSFERLSNRVLHRYRMQWLYADDYHCDDHCLLVIPSSRFNTAGRIGARNQSTMTLCTRSLSPSMLHSPCTPLAMFLGARRIDRGCDQLHMQIACRNHMRAIAIATSRICD